VFEGPRPGSKVFPGYGKEPVGIRKEQSPPQLRMLVRAKCTDNPSPQQLQEMAEKMSHPTGGVVEIDFKTVDTPKVQFFAVIAKETRFTYYQMKANESGTYDVVSHRIDEKRSWHVERLRFGEKGSCLTQSELPVDQMYLTILNLLNRMML
jgi:hypothetical protein